MPIPLSPELVLVLPEAQREAAIRALPALPVWNPGPLGPAIVAAQHRVAQHRLDQRRATHVLIGAALLYLAVRLALTLATAAVYIVAIVGVVIVLALIL
jgi:hypothetical protein